MRLPRNLGVAHLLVVLSLVLLWVVPATTQGASNQQSGRSSSLSQHKLERRRREADRRVREGDRRRREAERKEREEKRKKANEHQGDSKIWDGLFPWANDGGFADNWLSGLGLGLLGIVGGLVMLYLFLGDFLPSMGGKAEYERLNLEVEDLAQRRDAQLKPRESFVRGKSSLGTIERDEATKLINDFNRIIVHKEEMARRAKRGVVVIGFPLYVVLGAAFAVLVASTAIQALAIGFGWTAVADRLGLKREEDSKKQSRDRQSAALSEAAKTAVEEKVEAERQLQQGLKIAAETVVRK